MAKKIKIVIVLPTVQGGGAERVAVNLANIWSRCGHKVEIVLFSSEHKPFYELDKTIKLSFIDDRNRFFTSRINSNIKRLRLLRRQIIANEPNVILSFLPQINVITLISTLGLETRVIVSERNDLTMRKIPWYWSLLRRLSYPEAELVTINDERNRKPLESFIAIERIRYVPNILIPPRTKPCLSRRSQIILAVGRLHHQKGFDILIDAFFCSKIWAKNWRLQIVGDGPEKSQLKHQIELYKMNDSIDIFRPLPTIWDEFGKASIFIMPSRYEGMPNSLLEALHLGLLPIVSKGVGSLAHEIQSYDNNLVVPVNAKDHLCSSIIYATANLTKLQSLIPEFQAITVPFLEKNAIVHWNKLLEPS